MPQRLFKALIAISLCICCLNLGAQRTVAQTDSNDPKAQKADSTYSILESNTETPPGSDQSQEPTLAPELEKPPAPNPPAIPQPPIAFDSVPAPGGDYEILLQGPVHEAFGSQSTELSGVSRPAIVADRAPPAAIQEERPQEIPAGNNPQWIEGYWSWDAAREDFIWVSGMYREVPPGRTWVKGAWQQVGTQYLRHAGYWGVAGVQSTYLPAPPQPLETKPTLPAPDENSFWMPGEWVYQDDSYSWQDGYWTQHYQDWIWQPSCYANTAQGHVYVSGYWDYEPTVRGVPFASVYLPPTTYQNAQFRYVPAFPVARSAALLLNLFVRPGYRSFYYGDLYSNRFASYGLQPWYLGSANNLARPSLVNYYQWKYGQSGIAFSQSLGRYNTFLNARPANSRSALTIQSGNSILTTPLPQNYATRSFDSLVRASILGQAPPSLLGNTGVGGRRSSSAGFSGASRLANSSGISSVTRFPTSSNVSSSLRNAAGAKGLSFSAGPRFQNSQSGVFGFQSSFTRNKPSNSSIGPNTRYNNPSLQPNPILPRNLGASFDPTRPTTSIRDSKSNGLRSPNSKLAEQLRGQSVRNGSLTPRDASLLNLRQDGPVTRMTDSARLSNSGKSPSSFSSPSNARILESGRPTGERRNRITSNPTGPTSSSGAIRLVERPNQFSQTRPSQSSEIRILPGRPTTRFGSSRSPSAITRPPLTSSPRRSSLTPGIGNPSRSRSGSPATSPSRSLTPRIDSSRSSSIRSGSSLFRRN
ncbi:MAG: hypothetical protein AAF483_04205 [Planctomycetota bacterium]